MDFIKKNWFWLIPLVFAAALFVWLKKTGKLGDAKKTQGSAVANVPDATLNKTVVLYNGIVGYQKEVSFLQGWLNSRGGQLSVDGKFGPLTAAELKKQKGVWQIAIKDL
jgi:hypothetical protein